MEAADDNVMASEHRREIIDGIGIAFFGDHPVELRHSTWIPHDCCDLMTAPHKFDENSRSAFPRRPNKKTLHFPPPPMSNFPDFATLSLATSDTPLRSNSEPE